jgi:hypothetical protein
MGYHYAMPSPRRFPAPWSIDESEACFIVRDHDKQALAYVYFEGEPAAIAGRGVLFWAVI